MFRLMRTVYLLLIIGFFTLALLLPNTAAQYANKMSLPESAKMRIGKGYVNEIAFSPDATRLAVAGVSELGFMMSPREMKSHCIEQVSAR
ncbi:MAG: hypothetical protein OXU51_11625 [Candidatus Poribacteria bacterium]|nr:hypothetical protein [Candidatus Poribacteria bacterium]